MCVLKYIVLCDNKNILEKKCQIFEHLYMNLSFISETKKKLFMTLNCLHIQESRGFFFFPKSIFISGFYLIDVYRVLCLIE